MNSSVGIAWVGLGCSMVLAVAGCGSGEQPPDNAAPSSGADTPTPVAPAECVVATGTLSADTNAADWAGTYAVTMISSDGTRVHGGLTLRAQAEEFQTIVGPGGEPAPNTRIPLYGWIDVDVGTVGAVVPGDATSEDPEAPGVALLESRMGDRAPDILLRLGSEANRRGQVRFDGAFTVMRVTEADAEGFRGRWNSGVGLDRSEGPFCAWIQP